MPEPPHPHDPTEPPPTTPAIRIALATGLHEHAANLLALAHRLEDEAAATPSE